MYNVISFFFVKFMLHLKFLRVVSGDTQDSLMEEQVDDASL